jgi:hypothetical protein
MGDMCMLLGRGPICLDGHEQPLFFVDIKLLLRTETHYRYYIAQAANLLCLSYNGILKEMSILS